MEAGGFGQEISACSDKYCLSEGEVSNQDFFKISVTIRIFAENRAFMQFTSEKNLLDICNHLVF